MEKINVAELLRDCPQGMELDCYLFTGLEFDHVDTDNEDYPIVCRVKSSSGEYYKHAFTKYGWYTNFFDYAKCVIFPKGRTTWEGFVPPYNFKDGDIIYNQGIKATAIFNKQTDDNPVSHCFLNILRELKICHYHSKDLSDWRLATEEEKEKLFQAIKDNGYKWNEDTKTLEELVESKEDTNDEVVVAGIYFNRGHYSDEVELHLGNYEIEVRDGKTYAIFKNKETKESKPKFKVGDTIIPKDFQNKSRVINAILDNEYNLFGGGKIPFSDQDNYELVPNNFDITTLVPFESRVLVRNDEHQYWIPAFWGCKRTDGYTTTFGWCKYCIPFDGNEHLLETNNDCNEYYKTWK